MDYLLMPALWPRAVFDRRKFDYSYARNELLLIRLPRAHFWLSFLARCLVCRRILKATLHFEAPLFWVISGKIEKQNRFYLFLCLQAHHPIEWKHPVRLVSMFRLSEYQALLIYASKLPCRSLTAP